MLSYDIDSSTQVSVEIKNNSDYVQIGGCKLFNCFNSPIEIHIHAQNVLSTFDLCFNLGSYNVIKLGETERKDQVTNISVCDNGKRLLISFISNHEICEFEGHIIRLNDEE